MVDIEKFKVLHDDIGLHPVIRSQRQDVSVPFYPEKSMVLLHDDPADLCTGQFIERIACLLYAESGEIIFSDAKVTVRTQNIEIERLCSLGDLLGFLHILEKVFIGVFEHIDTLVEGRKDNTQKCNGDEYLQKGKCLSVSHP